MPSVDTCFIKDPLCATLLKAYVNISGPNIARSKDALQGPGSLQNQGPQLAVDGNLNTTNHGVTCAHTSK